MSPRPDLADASDHQVVAWALEGREEARTELVRRYQQPVYTAISRLVDEPETAEDLTQETFLKVFEALQTQRPDAKFAAWIFKIANNTAVNHLKRERRLKRQRLDTVPLAGSTDPSAPRKVRVRTNPLAAPSHPTPVPLDAGPLAPALKAAIERLREKDRQCYTLHEIEGRSYGYIADLLDLPVGTVGWYIRRPRGVERAVRVTVRLVAGGFPYADLNRPRFDDTPRSKAKTPGSALIEH